MSQDLEQPIAAATISDRYQLTTGPRAGVKVAAHASVNGLERLELSEFGLMLSHS
jgi:hypothetical protein